MRFRTLCHRLHFFLCSPVISRTRPMSQLWHQPPDRTFSSPRWLMLLCFVHVSTSSTNTFCPRFCLETSQSLPQDPVSFIHSFKKHFELLLYVTHSVRSLAYRVIYKKNIIHPPCVVCSIPEKATHGDMVKILIQHAVILVFAFTFWIFLLLAFSKIWWYFFHNILTHAAHI